MSIQVSIPQRLITGFKIRAAKAWPAEFIAFIIGRCDGDSYEVLDIWYPPNWRDHCIEGEVDGDEAWWRDAMEFAAAKRMMPMGTIHTHSYSAGLTVFDEVPSLGDLPGKSWTASAELPTWSSWPTARRSAATSPGTARPATAM